MPDHVYEVIAQGARYWFLFWMALIVWRSWRWYRRDCRAAKKRLKLLPDAGYVGEMVMMNGPQRGAVYPVPWEGTLGQLRTNDLSLLCGGVANRHLWFRYEQRRGLMVRAYGQNAFSVDGQQGGSREALYMAHGSWLTVGEAQLRLRLFAGFESPSHAQRREAEAPQPQEPAQDSDMARQMQQIACQQMQQAWLDGYRQAMAQNAAPPAVQPPAPPQQPPVQPPQIEAYDEDPDALPYDMAQLAREEGLVDDSIFMRPQDQPRPEVPQQEAFYPPVEDGEEDEDEDDWVLEPDDAPPRSAYVGHDEAARAKREVWDKYFGGGAKR